jgi:hypothetical protein
MTSNFSGTIVVRTWQIGENFAPIATMENKLKFLRLLVLQKYSYLYDGPK